MTTFHIKPKLSELAGYDARIEHPRRFYFLRFQAAKNRQDQLEALRGLASVTSLRSATFISAYEAALGITDE